MQTDFADLHAAARKIRAGAAEEVLPHLARQVRSLERAGPAHSLYIEALIACGRRSEASDVLMACIPRAQGDANAHDAFAFLARQLGLHKLSSDLYRTAAELAPADPQLLYNLATSERSLGRLQGAAEACARALELRPDFRPAILLRSELGRATPEKNNIADLQARLARSTHNADAMFFSYALAKELHEVGRYDEAMPAFWRGASLRRQSLKYDVAIDEQKLSAIASAFSDQGPKPVASGARHIFIVGLPRSGTTLTERILGGLAQVRSNDETENFSSALMRHSLQSGGSVFERAANADFGAVSAEYDILSGANEGAEHIIEKLPFNYLYIGAILRAFGDASIVWVRRDPVDSCFAMFRTLFAAAYPFSYDFGELARYFAAYQRLMRHWSDLYGDRLIEVHYENLVERPGGVASELASRCGLTWQDGALDISQNTSVSLTASASQVRGGIYTGSSGIWRKYADHLVPLLDALEQQGVVTGRG